MHAWRIVLLGSSLVFAAVSTAGADIKGPKGEKCESVESNSKHDIKGKPYTCDKCVYLQCDAGRSGTELKNCARVTYWTNCVEVPASPPPKR